MSVQDFLSPIALKELSFLQVISTILIGLITYVVVGSVYNVWFHPLSRYPGPLLARATELVHYYYWLRGDLVPFLERLHTEYGETVRHSPTRVSLLQPEAWKDLHGYRAHVVKDESIYVRDLNGRYSLLSIVDDAKHAQIRKIFSAGFSERGLKAQEGLIRNHVDKLIKSVYRASEDGGDGRIDAVKMYNCTTFDIIGELAFGESLGLLDNSALNHWVENIMFGLENGAIRAFCTEYRAVGWALDLFAPKWVKDLQNSIAKYSEDRVEKRMAKGKVVEKPDFWSLVLAQHEAGVLDVPDMVSNANLFMIAGSETTATMLSGLTYNLLMNPDKLHKVVHEVRSAFQSEEELTMENIARLKYLSACFEESMRIYPSVPVGPARVMLKGGGTIAGNYLPEKARVSIAQYAAYHSPKNFADPLSFIPERWITDDPLYPKYANDRKSVFQPFSVGPRNCIGKNLALHEMRLIAVKMLWHFDLEIYEESKHVWLDQKVAWALWKKPSLWVKATPIRRP